MRTTLLLAALVAILAGCGGKTANGSADAFIKQVTVQFARGQAGPLWDELLPSEQRLVSRSRYIACAGNGFRLRSFKVLDSYEEEVAVPAGRRPSTAVSVQVVSDDGVTTATVHAVQVAGHWHWILSPRELAAFSAGRCP